MQYLDLVTIIALVVGLVLVAVLLVFGRVVRQTFRRDALLQHSIASLSDAVAMTGLTVVVGRWRSMEQAEALLRVEYPLYEVVLVADSQSERELWRKLASRYKLVSVNLPDNPLVVAEGVRGLYRSSVRTLRHLVVVDRPHTTLKEGWMVGALVASNDYIMALRDDETLAPSAVRGVVGIVATRSVGEVERVVSIGSCGVQAVRCDLFEPTSRGWLRGGARGEKGVTELTCSPLVVAGGRAYAGLGRVVDLAVFMALVGGAVWCYAEAWDWAVALLLWMLFVWSFALYLRPYLAQRGSVAGLAVSVVVWSFRIMKLKFFSLKKNDYLYSSK